MRRKILTRQKGESSSSPMRNGVKSRAETSGSRSDIMTTSLDVMTSRTDDVTSRGPVMTSLVDDVTSRGGSYAANASSPNMR